MLRPLAACVLLLPALAALASGDALPGRLAETGLTRPDGSVRPEVLSFTPQYALWSDGAAKRRWLYLPPGSAIDARDPDAWDFPRGTKLWKEFSHGDAVETRLIERLDDGSWRYAAYVWNADGSDALLAPERGLPRYPVAAAPGGRYDVPSRDDCRACHEGTAVPVLGFSALQLSPLRDERAPHAEPKRPGDIDLADLLERGLLVNLPPNAEAAPRIPAANDTERAALGYLHANCGHCHNARGSLGDLELSLAQGAATKAADTLRTLARAPSEFRLAGADVRLAPGAPEASVLYRRMRSRHPVAQMPPLGTRIADADGLALIESWISQDLSDHEVMHND